MEHCYMIEYLWSVLSNGTNIDQIVFPTFLQITKGLTDTFYVFFINKIYLKA